jgi:hypothetical protein
MKTTFFGIVLIVLPLNAAIAQEQNAAAEASNSRSIPLKEIWSTGMQGTRSWFSLDLTRQPGTFPQLDLTTIQKSLADAKGPPAAAFIVLGRGCQALLNAREVFAGVKKAIDPVPAESEVSLFFFSYLFSFGTAIETVKIEGNVIEVRYQLTPYSATETTNSVANISLGKLLPGQYEVKLIALPVDQTKLKPGMKAPTEEEIASHVCKPFSFSVVSTEIKFDDLGEFEGVENAIYRMGGLDRMVLVEDRWELDRFTRLIPKLPQVDLQTESLVVLTSWMNRPRTLTAARREGSTTVFNVRQQQQEDRSSMFGEGKPPKFHVYRCAKCPNAVRFEINDKPSFTIVRGEELQRRSDQIWNEIIDLRSSGQVNRLQYIHLQQKQFPAMGEEDLLQGAEGKDKFMHMRPAVIYPMLFRELVDMRAKPTIPRIFELLQSLGKFDPMQQLAFDALVGIGGPELLPACKEAIKSWNPRCRETAMNVLAAIALPETRDLAREYLLGPDNQAVYFGLHLLKNLGVRRDDVPTLVRSLENFESILLDPNATDRRAKFLVTGASSDTIFDYIAIFKSLGAEAEEALPVLDRMAKESRYPNSKTFHARAAEAAESIRNAIAAK